MNYSKKIKILGRFGTEFKEFLVSAEKEEDLYSLGSYFNYREIENPEHLEEILEKCTTVCGVKRNLTPFAK